MVHHFFVMNLKHLLRVPFADIASETRESLEA